MIREIVRSICAVISGARPSIVLAVPLYCPRCDTRRYRCTRLEAAALIADVPLHHRCGMRLRRGDELP